MEKNALNMASPPPPLPSPPLQQFAAPSEDPVHRDPSSSSSSSSSSFAHSPSLLIIAYNNNFFGPLPLGLAKLPHLRYIHLGGNFFSGEISESYGGIGTLEYLGLNENALSGRVPVSLSRLTNLREMYIGYYNTYEGGIPPEFGMLTSLVWPLSRDLSALDDASTFHLLGTEDLPQELCAFAISSLSKRCVLESARHDGGPIEYQCRTSEVVVERMSDWIETNECVKACGVDRNSVGISSDSLLEPQFSKKLCSPACRQNCPNIVDWETTEQAIGRWGKKSEDGRWEIGRIGRRGKRSAEQARMGGGGGKVTGSRPGGR